MFKFKKGASESFNMIAFIILALVLFGLAMYLTTNIGKEMAEGMKNLFGGIW